MKRFLIIATILYFATFAIAAFSQEALKSTEEEYYDFLSLQGLVERPTLGYRTLSDSEWNLTEEAKTADGHVWKNNSLGSKWTVFEPSQKADNFFTRGIDQSIKVKVYGPEWYNSYNTAAPYGQNDGALWQGKGYNSSFTAGARLEAYGLEATFKPQLSFSQNREFDLMDNSAYYSNKYAYIWGYGNDIGVDAPQRFGDKAFFTYDWGDTEIRYTWHNLTAGLGTQAIWLGPAWLNPVLHSNNAPSYPKFDIGLRKTSIHLPWLGWYVGDVEGRMWIGCLSESDYFDDDEDNNLNMINGLSLSYAPSFLPGLTLGANKICLSKWNSKNAVKYLNPLYDVNDNEDQKLSLTADWIFPKVGFEVYGELGIDDYVDGWHKNQKLLSVIRHPSHTMTYTFGLKKAISIYEPKKLHGEIIFEWNNTEMSQDFQFEWTYNFGFHHIITQGYTNKGQWLGSGSGYGGNSQILAFNVIYSKGNTFLFIWRNNPDDNYIYSKAVTTSASDKEVDYRWYNAHKTNFNIGVATNYFFTPNLSLQGGFVYNLILNSQYNPSKMNEEALWYRVPSKIHNFQFSLGAKKSF